MPASSGNNRPVIGCGGRCKRWRVPADDHEIAAWQRRAVGCAKHPLGAALSQSQWCRRREPNPRPHHYEIDQRSPYFAIFSYG
jgi:hypothetical protein